MADRILFYVSAAPDLELEREALGRAVTEIPVTLGWRIVQSPGRDRPVDAAAIARADVHVLLVGGDIRAPVGQEWVIARRAGRRPEPFLKQDVMRTPAAQDFVRFVAAQAAWRPFAGADELRRAVLALLGEHLHEHAARYALRPAEYEALQAWRASLTAAAAREAGAPDARGAGHSSVILSADRAAPHGGVLLRRDREREPGEE